MALQSRPVPGQENTAQMCPHCSRMYADAENVPSKCRRCGCPLDSEKGREWSQSTRIDTFPAGSKSFEQPTANKAIQRSPQSK